MANVLRLTRCVNGMRGLIPAATRNVRLISTTPKKQETIAADTAPKTAEDFRDVSKQKNWVSWGFDVKNQEDDTNAMHSTAFFSITLCIVVAGFFYAYCPDPLLRDWSQREAFLVLRKREAAGLEPISRDFVDPSTIELPSEEELEGVEIII